MFRIHNLKGIKENIKANASEAHNLRAEARTLSGMDRHYTKQSAKGYSGDTRCHLLAYGYLKGRTLSEMESPYSRIENFPRVEYILSIAKEAFNKGPDATPETAQDWDAFEASVKVDIVQWKTKLAVSSAERKAKEVA
jgi:hypothetical protein